MSYFLYGSDEKYLNDFIDKYRAENSFVYKKYDLTNENLDEIFNSISSESLFGEKLLYIIDITNTDEDIVFMLSSRLRKNSLEKSSNIIILYSGDLISRSKLLSSFEGFTFKNYKYEKPEIYKLTDLIIAGNLKDIYEELSKLGASNVDEIHVFNLIVSAFRSVEYLCLDLEQKKSIPPFKKNFYEKVSKRFNVSQIKDISQKLFEIDLKFKTGELTEDMVLTSLILLFHKI